LNWESDANLNPGWIETQGNLRVHKFTLESVNALPAVSGFRV